jgi:hypothetical protein
LKGFLLMAAMRKRRATRYWSQRVTRESNALDLEEGVFVLDDPAKIAASLKRSAEASTRRKAEPYRSALSMPVFYINRAGRGLPARRRRILERAKDELRKAFGRQPPQRRRKTKVAQPSRRSRRSSTKKRA